jgi:carbamoyltransferase
VEQPVTMLLNPSVAMNRPTGLPSATSRKPDAQSAVVVGISGARRNPAAAVAVGGRLHAFCEQERLTRIRGGGLRPGELPAEAVKAVLASSRKSLDHISAYVTAEDGLCLPSQLPRVRLEHHHCHAAAAFLTSPFDNAAVLVCDQNSSPDVSVFMGRGSELSDEHWPWSGEGFATLFTQGAQLFGFTADQEHRLEALARLDPGSEAERLIRLFQYAGGTLRVDPDWKKVVREWLTEDGPRPPLETSARVASSFQRALGDALLALVADIRRSLGVSRLCLGGGLFYNTFFNTLIAQSGEFSEVFVAPNPGNAGLAAGAALALSQGRPANERQTVSPFLGPEYSLEEIKADLDGCKLSYDCLSLQEIMDTCVQALLAGRLVGWFQGGMEWGHRALGNRSILASPLSPYVLDNLNVYLKRRERYRAYSLSVREKEVHRYFDGPPQSRWMEYEYRLRDPELFRGVLPDGASTLRVHTVDGESPLFSDLHEAFAAASGTGVLVSTSFNGFAEPIVCSPRDAIRVFYGTGLDVLVLGRFVLRK